MKNYIFTLLAIGSLFFTACDDENNATLTEPQGVRLVDLGLPGVVMNASNSEATTEAFKLTWQNFSATTVVEGQMSLTPDFEMFQSLGTSENGFVSVSYMDLSTALSNLGAVALEENTVYMRAMAGETASNAITLKVTSSSLPAPSPILNTEPDGMVYTIVAAEANDVAENFMWTYANGTDTEITYFVELDNAGNDFANAINLGEVSNATNLEVTQIQLNNAALQLGTATGDTADLELRIRATFNDAGSTVESFSETVSFMVETAFILPRMAVPGNHQGWQPDETIAAFVPYIAASGVGETDYEGFVFLDGGYKFVEPNATGEFVWGNTDWGDDGSFANFMIDQGEVNFEAFTPGFYLVRADTSAFSYSSTLTNWGIIGAATPSGWGSDTDMTYDATSRTWKITVNLTADEFKFRANDAWSINIGTDDDNDGSLNFNGGNFSATEAGTYEIELDLTTPRLYKVSIVKL